MSHITFTYIFSHSASYYPAGRPLADHDRSQQNSSSATGGPDIVFDYKTMYENTLKIALNSTCMKDLNKNVLPYVYLALF